MRNYIETLKAKPHGHRRAIALGVSGAITALILVVWLSTMGYRYGSADATAKAKAEEGPFTVIGNNVANVFSSVKSDIIEAKDYYEAR